MPQNISVTRLSPLQSEQLVQVLTRAFHDDPVFQFLLPDERTREKRLGWLFRSSLRYGLSIGEVYATEAVGGGAIWIGPESREFSFRQLLRTGLLAAPFRLGWGPFRRLLTLTAVLDEAHKQAMPDRHWYLMVLGVDPTRQGQGLGGQLLQSGLRPVDLAQLPCYLETFEEANLPFYETHGFRVVSQRQVPHGPRFWSMRRPAGARPER